MLHKIIYISVIILLFLGCTSPKEEVVLCSVNERGWTSPVEFTYNNADTVSNRDILLILRYKDNFRRIDFGAEIKVIAPDSMIYTDTLYYKLEDNSKFYSYSVKEFNAPLITKARFSKQGDYRFIFKQLISIDEPLKGIIGIGIAL